MKFRCSDDPVLRLFKADRGKDRLESGETYESYLERKYRESLDYYEHRFENYSDTAKIPLEDRYRIEDLAKRIVEILRKNGVSQASDGKYNIRDIMLRFFENGSDELREVNVASAESCWSSICFEMTEDEIEDMARWSAKTDLDSQLYCEHTKREQAKKEEEDDRKKAKAAYEDYEKKYLEFRRDHPDEPEYKNPWRDYAPKLVPLLDCLKEAKEEAQTSSPSETGGPKTEDFVEKIVNDLEMVSSGRNHGFPRLYDTLDNDVQKLIDEYILQCQRFSDAMNEGLTGMGLYAFNSSRSDAHYKMLEAFGLENDDAALRVTKEFDFADTWGLDHGVGKFIHRDKDDVRDYLAYALVQCRQRKTEYEKR